MCDSFTNSISPTGGGVTESGGAVAPSAAPSDSGNPSESQETPDTTKNELQTLSDGYVSSLCRYHWDVFGTHTYGEPVRACAYAGALTTASCRSYAA